MELLAVIEIQHGRGCLYTVSVFYRDTIASRLRILVGKLIHRLRGIRLQDYCDEVSVSAPPPGWRFLCRLRRQLVYPRDDISTVIDMVKASVPFKPAVSVKLRCGGELRDADDDTVAECCDMVQVGERLYTTSLAALILSSAVSVVSTIIPVVERSLGKLLRGFDWERFYIYAIASKTPSILDASRVPPSSRAHVRVIGYRLLYPRYTHKTRFPLMR